MQEQNQQKLLATSDLTQEQIEDSVEIAPVRRFIATVTLVLPNIAIGKRARSGAMILAKQTVTNEMVSQEWIDKQVKQGFLFEEESAVPTFREVRESLDDETANVSSVVKGGVEDNPLDDGIDLVSSGSDPALESRLNDIAAEQEESGIENDGSDLEPEAVTINAETGEIERTGGEPDFDDDEDERQADAQVS